MSVRACVNKIQETCCRLASPRVLNLRSFSTLAALCQSAEFACCDVERDLVSFPSKRFLRAAIIFVNLFHFRPSYSAPMFSREKRQNEIFFSQSD